MASESIKNCSLHKLVQERRKEAASHISVAERLKLKCYQFWTFLCIPSWRSGLTAVGLIVFGFFIIDYMAGSIPHCVSCWFSFIPEFINSHHEHYQNPISILTGIGTIIFALVIFVAETFQKRPQNGTTLLKQSFIWPLMIWVVFSFPLLLWMTNSGAILFWLLITIILVLTSLGRVIYAFLSGKDFRSEKPQRLLLILRNTLSPSIDDRLAPDILSSYLEDSKIPLIFSPYALVRGKHDNLIQASKTGRITDINLCKLQEFAKFLEAQAQKNNYSYTDTPPSGAEDSKHTGSFKQRLSKLWASLWAKISRNPVQKTSSQTSHPAKNCHGSLLKQYGDIISADDTSLLCYDRQLIANDPQAQRNLEKIAEKIFTIKPVNWIAETQTDLKTELRNLRDEFSYAIRSDSTGRVQELSDFYTKIIENFLTEISVLTDGSSSIQAREKNKIYWLELEWISQDLLSLQEQVVKTDNIEMIRNTTHIPIEFARRAVKHHEHGLFQQSLRSIPHLYVVAERTDMQPHIKQMLIGRCCMYIQELWRFDIGYGLKQSGISDVDVESHYRFALHLLFVFQELLRYSCQRRDIESFKKFLKQLSGFPDWVYSNSMSVQGDGEVRWLEGELEDKKKQMLFGLTAYVMSHLDGEQGKAEQKLFDFYNALLHTLSLDVKELTAIYVDYRQSNAGYYWGVDLWDIPDDGDVHVVQFSTEINQLYVVLALNRLKNKQVKDIDRLELPLSKTLTWLADENGSLSETLDEIKRSPDKWKHLINRTAIRKIPAFKRLMKRVIEGQKSEREHQKAKSDISPGKVTAFKKEFVTAFHEATLMFKLFTYLGRYEERNEPYREDYNDCFGFNVLRDKDMFLENANTSYAYFGHSYGEGVATDLDRRILAELTDSDKPAGKIVSTPIAALKECLMLIPKHSNVVLICSDREKLRDITGGELKPHWYRDAEQPEIKCFSGYLKIEDREFPVFSPLGTDYRNDLFLIRGDKFCDLVIKNPLSEQDNPEKQTGIFYIDINAPSHSEASMQKLIDEAPEWLTKRSDEEKVQREYLKGRVQMEIFLRYHLKWDDNAEILHFIMPEMP